MSSYIRKDSTRKCCTALLHRATLLCAVGSFAFAWMRPASMRVRFAVSAASGLVFVQIVLGLLNVVLRLPMDLREAHAFNAALVFLAFVVATLFAVLDLRVPAYDTSSAS